MVHDSCADRKKQEVGRAVSALLLPSVKLRNEGKQSVCCGAGGGVNFSNPQLSQEVASHRMQEASAEGVERLIVYCVNCALQLTDTKRNIPVTHILELVLNRPQDFESVAARIKSIR